MSLDTTVHFSIFTINWLFTIENVTSWGTLPFRFLLISFKTTEGMITLMSGALSASSVRIASLWVLVPTNVILLFLISHSTPVNKGRAESVEQANAVFLISSFIFSSSSTKVCFAVMEGYFGNSFTFISKIL